ncbi:MAG: S24 family peptidase, partial [Clostridia bacterium]|nr:S24 family peptidase [Clostridia bacterium]
MTRPSQRERILDFVCGQYAARGYPPTINEIAAHLGLCAKSNIHRQLQQLVAEGRLENRGGRYVPPAEEAHQTAKVAMVPLLGTVAAGSPILALESLEGYVAYLPRLGDGDDLFALKIKGDSMIEAGILDGDIV